MTDRGDCGSDLPISFSRGDRGLHLTQCYLVHTSVSAKWHLITSNGFSRMHERDRHAHGQSDGPRADTSVAVGGVADAITPNINNNNNNNNNNMLYYTAYNEQREPPLARRPWHNET